MTTSHYPAWARPREATPQERISSLRNGLIATYLFVQACFVMWVGAIHLAAATAKNGNGFHDLGVYVAREMALQDAYQLWTTTAVVGAAAFAGLYLYLKGRWSR